MPTPLPTKRERAHVRTPRMHDPRVYDAGGELISRTGPDGAELDDAAMDEVTELFEALRAWHATAERHSAASRAFMRLGETDMRAVRFLIAAAHTGTTVTPTLLAHELGITGPSVTKLLDRLERTGHVRRGPHPSDRRALTVAVTDETRRAARDSVGRDHARRFAVAASMSSEERRAATRFLRALAELPAIDHAAAAAAATDAASDSAPAGTAPPRS